MATRSATKTKPKAAVSGSNNKAKATAKAAAAAPKTPPSIPPASKAPVVAASKPAAPDAARVATEMKRKELVEEVSRRAELPKHKVKPVVEAMISVMGEAVTSGRTMNLQPLGRLVHKRRKEHPNATISIVRIRQAKQQD
ncbi:MAG: HU family DNA-binding protein [Pseudomonadota bacterium]